MPPITDEPGGALPIRAPALHPDDGWVVPPTSWVTAPGVSDAA